MLRTILLFCVGILCPLMAAAQIYLQYQLAPRSSYTYMNTSRVTQQMTVMEQDLTTQISVDTKFRVNVTDAIMKQYTLACVYDTARIRSSVSGIESMSPRKDSTIVFSALAGATETMTIAANGKILSSTMSMSSEASAMLASLASSAMSGMRRFFMTYPAKDISAGETWTSSTIDTNSTRSMNGNVITSTDLTYRFDRTLDTLGFRCVVISSASTKMTVVGTVQQSGMDMTLDGNGTIKGVSYIDVTDGMPVLSTASVDMSTRLAMVGQSSMIIPLEMQSIVSVQRVGLK
ncbi:hypothetical protein BH10BAC6_BH10BAC6_06930 [soil metagenome]